MALSSVIHKLFPEEFVIDEQPLPVLDPQALQPAPSPDQDSSAPDLPVDAYFNGAARNDVLSQIATMLVDQFTLLERARQLEQRRPSDDEFGRFVRNALPFLDNFAHLLDLAREHPPSAEIDNWLRSVEALYFRIVKLLEEYGLRFINSVGKPVDLEYHEVVEYRRTADHPHNYVIKELQKGVVFRNRLIRDAKVVVACNE